VPYGRQSTRTGAALGVAGIALIVGGFALVAPAGATITSSAEEIADFYTGSSVPRVMAGGLLECLGFVFFLAFATMLTGRLRGPGATGELVPDLARLAATGYVVVCLAPGMSAGAAALWLAHRGSSDPQVLLALNHLRGFSYFVALLFLAVFLVCVGISAAASGRLPRWAAWSALVIGAGIAATVPVATSEVPDMLALLALAWVVVVGVALLRSPDPAARR
jgi:hypothetical protein